jgi:integrase
VLAKTFKRKKDAEDFAANTRVQLGERTHVADSASVTAKEAGELWLQSSRAAHLEPTTIEMYSQHLRLHITPFIGREKLSRLSVPLVRAFSDRLHKEGRSSAMIRKFEAELATDTDTHAFPTLLGVAWCEKRSVIALSGSPAR